MSGTRDPFLRPPFQELPLNKGSGEHSQAWQDFFEETARQVQALQSNAGVTNGSDAAAGKVGEYLSAQVSPSAIAHGVGVNVVTLSLSAGDYDVQGSVNTVPDPTTTTSLLLAGISVISESVAFPAGGSYVQHASAVAAGNGMVLATGRRRVNLSSSANVYLVAMVLIGGGGMQIGGFLGARRVR